MYKPVGGRREGERERGGGCAGRPNKGKAHRKGEREGIIAQTYGSSGVCKGRRDKGVNVLCSKGVMYGRSERDAIAKQRAAG